ncbi:MAG: hypothetical protein K9L25_12965, partial [Methylovulum sp.]|nr:hypothetical protein [Methylovulum sp.]
MVDYAMTHNQISTGVESSVQGRWMLAYSDIKAEIPHRLHSEISRMVDYAMTHNQISTGVESIVQGRWMLAYSDIKARDPTP